MYVHVPTTYVRCPKCDVAVDVHFAHLSSRLGPHAVNCHWCNAVTRTDRMEWSEMDWLLKSWFFGMSLLYMVIVYFAGGLSISEALHFADKGEWKNGWGIEDRSFQISGLIWAGFVGFIQLYRILRSLQRTMNEEQEPLDQSWWSFQVGGQLKVLLLLLLVPGLSWVGVSVAKLLLAH